MKIKNTLLLFMTAMIWGFAFIAQRVGVEHIGNYTFNAIRFALGAVSLLPVILFFEHRENYIQCNQHNVADLKNNLDRLFGNNPIFEFKIKPMRF